MLRFLEISALGAVVSANIATTAMQPPPEWIVQYGALAIVAFMVFQNYRQTRDMGRIIAKKDAQLETDSDAMRELIADYTAATNRLAQCLEDRPCIAGDQRIKPSS